MPLGRMKDEPVGIGMQSRRLTRRDTAILEGVNRTWCHERALRGPRSGSKGRGQAVLGKSIEPAHFVVASLASILEAVDRL